MPEYAIWLAGSASTLFGVWLGYELSRAARFGKPLIRLPKFKRDKPDSSKGRTYEL